MSSPFEVGLAGVFARAHAGTQFCPRVIEVPEALYRDEPAVVGAAKLRAVGEAAA